MASLAAFFEAPSVAFLKTCKKDELSRIADHFGITVPERVHKDELRDVIVSSLLDQGVLQQREKEVSEDHLSRKASLKIASQVAELTFEQQKELLSMQLEQEKLRRQELFELEKLRQNTEKIRLELEHSKLQLMREGPEVQDAGLDEDDETPGVPRIYGLPADALGSFFSLAVRGIVGTIQKLPTVQFSLIIDGTHDVAGVEQKCTCIRYMDHNLIPHKDFVELYEVSSTTGKDLVEMAVDVLLRLNLPLLCL
ncbi:uncharacterized protein V6R79_008142 [Siganus canaliculatus]